jgi:hypothetical protein
MFTILVVRPEYEAYANIVYGHLDMTGYNVRKDSNYELPMDTRINTHVKHTICIVGREEQEGKLVTIRYANNMRRTISLNEFFSEYK